MTKSSWVGYSQQSNGLHADGFLNTVRERDVHREAGGHFRDSVLETSPFHHCILR